MKKILVVDDEKPISDIIKFNMVKEGYEVVTAFNGREFGLDVARNGWFRGGANDSENE